MSHLWLFIFSLQILKTLHRTYAIMKMKSVWNDINPKAVTTDELFGYLHPATREWKDGENYTKKKNVNHYQSGLDTPTFIISN